MSFAQTGVVPEMALGWAGKGFTVTPKVLMEPVPQAVVGVTVIVPEVAVREKSAVMELVPAQVATVNPDPE